MKLLATLLLLSASSACSLPVNDAAGSLGSALYPECGWHKAEQRVNATCAVIDSIQAGCGVLPEGISPCDMDPEAGAYQANAGEHYAQWSRAVLSDCEFQYRHCSAEGAQ